MSFPTDTLKYNAYTYQHYTDPIRITEQEIKLVKKGDGYTVPDDHILVKVHAAALNPIDLGLYQSASFPFTLLNANQGIGRDFSGVVEAIGDGDDLDLKVGDNVCGMYFHPFGSGTLAEYVLLDAKADLSVSVIPSNLSLEEASSWPLVYGTAFGMFDGLEVKGKKVLVLGAATSVGRYVVSLARQNGAKEIVTTNSQRSLDLVSLLGADSQIDYSKHKSVLNPVLESVKRSGTFDVVLDCCGGSDLFWNAKDVISANGSYISAVGDYKYDYSDIPVLKNMVKRLLSIFREMRSNWGLLHYKYRFLICHADRRWIIEGKKLIEEGKVKVFIDSVHKFAELDKALLVMGSNKANGKIVVRVNE